MIVWAKALTFGLAVITQGGELTLDEALRIAEQNSYGLRIAASNVEKAKQRLAEVRGQLGPKVNGQASYTRFAEEQFQGGGKDSKQASVGVNMPLDLAGVTGKAVEAARANTRSFEETYRAARNDLRLTVKRAYFQVLQAEAQTVVFQQAVEGAQQRLKNAQAQFAAGAVARIDVVRFETQLAQAQTDLETSQNSLQVAKNSFNNALARPIETPVDLAEVPAMPQPSETPDTLVQTAQSGRPEVLSLKNSIEALRFVTKAQEGGMTPSVGLSANHQRTFGNGISTSDQNTFAAITLTVPIFDSGITRARVKQARQDEVQAATQLDQLNLGISLEVRQALTNLSSAKARLEVAEKQVRLAEETYRLSQIRYDAGEGIQLEVTDAQTELTRARTNLVNARYDYLRAYSELQRAVGSDTLAPVANSEGASK